MFHVQILQYLFILATDFSFCPRSKLCKATNSTFQGCPTGYFGSDCSLICRYPSYGKNCQMHCGCLQDRCNHISGCYMSQRCSTGYMGHNCENSCRYPSFGIDCQSKCCCTQDLCNHIFGCNTSNINVYEDDCRIICNDTQDTLRGSGCYSDFSDDDMASENDQVPGLNSVDLLNPYVCSIIISACLAFVLSITYACTYRKTCKKETADQCRHIDMRNNGEPIYDFICV